MPAISSAWKRCWRASDRASRPSRTAGGPGQRRCRRARPSLPDQTATYRSIESLIQHFELIMPNRQWETPIDEIYGCTESPNGELGFYIVADGTGTRVSRPHAAAVVHPLCHVSAVDRRTHAERRGGGAGEFEHYRGGIGSVTKLSRKRLWAVMMGVLSDEIRRKINGLSAALSQQAGGDVAGLAHRPGRAALCAAGSHSRNCRHARPQPGGSSRHDELLWLLSRRGSTSSAKRAFGSAAVWPACCAAARSYWRTCARRLGVQPGETTADGKITLEFAECIGACEGAPCVLIDDEARMNVRPREVDKLLTKLRN